MLYILARRPDEFGLLPDKDGFIKYKELLRAIHEEKGWTHVRQSHIKEVLLGKDRALFQPEDNRIRVCERKWDLDLDSPARGLPVILYIAVRKKAHPVVMEKGLHSSEGSYLVLSSDDKMALRMGRRRDQKPVLLEVMAAMAEKHGVIFYSFGDLFVSPQIPARFIKGPPVSRDILERRTHDGKQKEKGIHKQVDFTPGTFPLEVERDPDLYRRNKKKRRKAWKEEIRKLRRIKYR